MNKTEKKLEELEKAYILWAGDEAQQIEAQAQVLDPQYLVIVSRHVGRGIKTSEYLFATEEVATHCYNYWRARGGLVTLALTKVIRDFGYRDEPPMYF